jgi:hypothetical protein
MYDFYLQCLLFASIIVAMLLVTLVTVDALNPVPVLWHKIQKLFYESIKLQISKLQIRAHYEV